jgi:hypothetical protein
MKHIKSFFESNNLESDIRDCFLPLSDYLNVNFGRQDGKLKVSNNLDNIHSMFYVILLVIKETY